MKPGPRDIKLNILITGEELRQLQRHSYLMVEAFGLDRRIENYQGKRQIGLYSWDFDCLLDVIPDALENETEYPDKNDDGYKALMNLYKRLKKEYLNFS